MHGVVSVGDGIAVGHGARMRGVPCQGWPSWLSDAMDVCVTRLATGGATCAQVIEAQLPRIEGHFLLGTISIGTNDLLGDWDPGQFTRSLRVVVEGLLTHCETVALLNVASSGTRGADEANALIGQCAQHDVIVIDMSDLRGRRMIRGDLVHPTALGQLEIADRAAVALSHRVTIPRPSSMVSLGRLEREHAVRYPVERLRSAQRRLLRSSTRR